MFEKVLEKNNMPTCPLCLVSGMASDVKGADGRRYHLCSNCFLIFVDPCHHLPRESERARYAAHQNTIENDGYVRFLSRLLHPMLPFLHKAMRGLDYGCGPGPTLSKLVERHGIACDDYDPLFACHPLRPPYDVIFSTECFEHFHTPSREIQSVCNLLKPGGLLGIMTERWTTVEQFRTWNYTTDATHTSFYHERTFAYLCDRFKLHRLWQDMDRVMILRRS